MITLATRATSGITLMHEGQEAAQERILQSQCAPGLCQNKATCNDRACQDHPCNQTDSKRTIESGRSVEAGQTLYSHFTSIPARELDPPPLNISLREYFALYAIAGIFAGLAFGLMQLALR